jgi:hypothetical protein
MNLDDLRCIGNTAKESAFRLETLPQYLVPQEVDEFAAWQAGESVPLRTPENSPGLARVQRDIARGFRWYRVHILDQPLTAYLRFELYGYLLENQPAGTEIYVVDRGDHAALAELHEDFIIFDDEIAVQMVYDDEGHFLYPELINDIEPYRHMRDTSLRHAEPLTDYMARKNLTPETLRMTS